MEKNSCTYKSKWEIDGALHTFLRVRTYKPFRIKKKLKIIQKYSEYLKTGLEPSQ